MAGERPTDSARRISWSADEQGSRRTGTSPAKRKRMNVTDRLGWVTGARVLDACGVEHVIQAMQHGYVQCSRPGCSDLRNYRRRELGVMWIQGGLHTVPTSAV